MTLFGPPNIEKMKSNHDIKGLIKALAYRKDSVIRNNAASALGELKDPDAIDSLNYYLNNGDEYLQAASAEALAKIDNSRAIDLLIRGCQYQKTRKVSINAMKKNPALATKQLTEQLQDISEGKRSANILQEMGWSPSANKEGAYYWIRLGNYWECANLGSPGVNILREYIRDYSNWDAIMALAHVGDPENYAFLLSSCGPLYSSNWKNWFHTLGYIKDEKSVSKMIRNLIDYFDSYHKDSTLDNEVKKEAIVTLRKIGDPGKAYLLEILQKRKEGKNSKVLDIAIDALIEMKEFRAFWPVVEIWFDDRCTKKLENIKKFGEEGIIELCNGLLSSHNLESACALSSLCDTYSIKSIVDGSKDRNSIVNSLISAFTDPKIVDRWCTIKALADIGDPKAIPYLVNSLNDKNGSKECSQALERFGALAIEPLECALKVEELCRRAYDVLIKLGWKPSKDPEFQNISNKIEIERILTNLADAHYYSTYCKGWADKLDTLGWQPGEDMTSACYWIAKGNYEKCCSLGNIAIEPLVKQMCEDTCNRREILKILESFGHEIVVEANNKLEEFRKRKAALEEEYESNRSREEGERAFKYWETHWGGNE